MTKAHYVIEVVKRDEEALANLVRLLGRYKETVKQRRSKSPDYYIKRCDITDTIGNLPDEINIYMEFDDSQSDPIDVTAAELQDNIERTADNWMDLFSFCLFRGGKREHIESIYSKEIQKLKGLLRTAQKDYDDTLEVWDAETAKVKGLNETIGEKDKEIEKVKKERGEEIEREKKRAVGLERDIEIRDGIIQKKKEGLTGQQIKIEKLEKEKKENEDKLKGVDQLKSDFDDLDRDYRRLQTQSSAGVNQVVELQKELDEKRKRLEEERKSREEVEERARKAEDVLVEIINNPERAFREYLKGNAETLNSLYEIADEALSHFGAGKKFNRYLSMENKSFADYFREFADLPQDILQIISPGTTAEDIRHEVDKLIESDELKALAEESNSARKMIDFLTKYREAEEKGEDIEVACGVDPHFARAIYHSTKIEDHENKLKDAEDKRSKKISELREIAENAVNIENEFDEANGLLDSLRSKVPSGAEIRYFVRRAEDREDSYVVRVLIPLDTEKRSGALRAQLDEHIISPFIELAGQIDGGVTVSDAIVEENLLGRDILFEKGKFDDKSVRKLTEDAVEAMKKSKQEYDIYKLGVGLKVINVGIF